MLHDSSCLEHGFVSAAARVGVFVDNSLVCLHDTRINCSYVFVACTSEFVHREYGSASKGHFTSQESAPDVQIIEQDQTRYSLFVKIRALVEIGRRGSQVVRPQNRYLWEPTGTQVKTAILGEPKGTQVKPLLLGANGDTS